MTTFTHAALVAAGSATGGVLRWATSRLFAHYLGTAWPYGTLFVNLTGCFFLGWVAAGEVTEHQRMLLAVGFAGGYTTFSTFGIETDILWRDRKWFPAALYVFVSVFAGLMAVRLGAWLGGASGGRGTYGASVLTAWRSLVNGTRQATSIRSRTIAPTRIIDLS